MKRFLLFIIILFIIIGCDNPSDSIPIKPERFTLFYDDIEYGIKNWTAEGDWRIITGYSYSLRSSWIERNGSYLPDQNYSLISETFDFTGYINIELNFWQAYWFEENYDFGYVEYTIDGIEWIEVKKITGKKYYWQECIINIPSETSQIRFRIETDSTNQYDGWFIDNIKITGE